MWHGSWNFCLFVCPSIDNLCRLALKCLFSSPDLCSGWAIVITFCLSSVRPLTFSNDLLWSHWANFAQISYGTSLGWGNERLLKWLWSFVLDVPNAHIWKKSFKKSFPELGMSWGWIFAQIIGDEGILKLLKWWSYIDVWPFYGEVKFASLCICMGPIMLKNVENPKLLWNLWANVAQISSGAS